ncbi:MAG: formylglycine-generating enzyme family protein [Crocosphaera sp.]
MNQGTQKRELLKILKEITPTQFTELIFHLDVKEAHLPSADKSQVERAIALLKLAQTRGGMGLNAVEKALEDVIETPKPPVLPPGNAQQYSENLLDIATLEMIAIPSGVFLMGGTKHKDEQPQHLVSLKSFYMGKYQVTQGQWLVIAQNSSLKVDIDLNPDPSHFKGVDRPVECVNWYECVEFCKRLSKLTGRDYGLPSEAQWEYACRAGTTTPYYCGETITTDLANYNSSGTTPVGQFPPNGFGLYDMHGNVWEWCADDWHDNYNGAPNDGSAWLDGYQRENVNHQNSSYSSKNKQNTSYSVLRGGSCINIPDICRSAFRDGFIDGRENRNVNFGFRVVCVFGRSL